MVLLFYQGAQILENSLRSDLVNCIVQEFYKKSYFMGINEFRCVANKIVELFPNEELATYFVAPNAKQKKSMGKLVDKHYNFIRKLVLIKKR
jgi:hypothetical protein